MSDKSCRSWIMVRVVSRYRVESDTSRPRVPLRLAMRDITLSADTSTRTRLSWFLCAASSRSRKDRKSTRLNSSHSQISYAVFCLKKKNRKRRGAKSGQCCPSFKLFDSSANLLSELVGYIRLLVLWRHYSLLAAPLLSRHDIAPV